MARVWSGPRGNQELLAAIASVRQPSFEIEYRLRVGPMLHGTCAFALERESLLLPAGNSLA